MMLVGFAVFLGACGQQGQPKENQPAQGDTAGQQQPQEEGAAQAPKSSQEREKGAFIKATPAPVPVGGKTGTTTISWSTGSEASSGEVYFVLDDGSEKLFAGESPEGSAEAPWIFEGGTYVFRLYAGTEQATLLDQVKVTTSEQARESTTK